MARCVLVHILKRRLVTVFEVWPRKKSREKLEQSIRELTPRRTCGCALEQCIASLNEVLKG